MSEQITIEDVQRAMKTMAPARCELPVFDAATVTELEPGVTRITGLSLVRYFIQHEDADYVGRKCEALLQIYPMTSGYSTVITRYAFEGGKHYAVVTRLKRLSDVLSKDIKPITSPEMGRRIDDAWQKGE